MSSFHWSSLTAILLRRRFILIACVLNMFGPVGHLLAQNMSTGVLVGTVMDPTGAVLPGTEITVTSEFTREQRSASQTVPRRDVCIAQG